MDVREIYRGQDINGNFKMANWEAFKYINEVKLQVLGFNEEMEDVEMYNEKLCKVLYSTAKEIIGKSKGIERKESVSWQTVFFSKTIQARKKGL